MRRNRVLLGDVNSEKVTWQHWWGDVQLSGVRIVEIRWGSLGIVGAAGLAV